MTFTKIWNLVKTNLDGWCLRAKRFVNSRNLDRAIHHAVRDQGRHTNLTQVKLANKTRTIGCSKARHSFTGRREASRLVSTVLSPFRLSRILRLNQTNLSSINATPSICKKLLTSITMGILTLMLSTMVICTQCRLHKAKKSKSSLLYIWKRLKLKIV